MMIRNPLRGGGASIGGNAGAAGAAPAAGAAALAGAGAAPTAAAPAPAGGAALPSRRDSGAAALAVVADALSPSSPAHPDGLSLAGLRAFVAEHGGESALAGKTTSDVKWEIVVPETKAAACSYANLLRARGRGGVVGRANAFVSHVYSERFLDVVEAIAAWEARQPAGAPPVFYYFDLIVVNQHGQSAAVASDVLWREFTGSVRAIGRTLVVLTLDAARKGPLTRAWCVAEIAAGLQGAGAGGGEGAGGGGGGGAALFEVIMTPSERAGFVKELTSNFANIAQRTCTVDLERTHAWQGDECLENGVCRDVAAGRVAVCSNDLGFVLDNVRREISFADVNQRVIARMREFMVDEARAVLKDMPGADARAGSALQYCLARLLQDCGRLAEAEALLRETVEVFHRTLGAEAQSTLATVDVFAAVLKHRGKLGEAEPLFRKALAVRRRKLGNAHPDTLRSINNLGGLLQDQGRLGEAEPLLREALATQRRKLGAAHPDTLCTIAWLGSLLQAQGKLGEAEPLFRESLVVLRRTLGDTHPDTLGSINNLSLLLQAQGKLDEAEPLFREALAALRRTLGDAHPNTLSTINNLGRLLADRSGASLAEAEALSREALTGRQRTLGSAHSRTLISLRDTANVLVSLGGAANLAEAALLDAEALAGFHGTLGEAHLDTLKELRVHGRVLAAQGDLAGATAALRASLDGFRAQNAVEARRSARELAAVLRALGDEKGADEAEASDPITESGRTAANSAASRCCVAM
jgi:tetratricopeptide (TPR) repeat protein